MPHSLGNVDHPSNNCKLAVASLTHDGILVLDCLNLIQLGKGLVLTRYVAGTCLYGNWNDVAQQGIVLSVNVNF